MLPRDYGVITVRHLAGDAGRVAVCGEPSQPRQLRGRLGGVALVSGPASQPVLENVGMNR